MGTRWLGSWVLLTEGRELEAHRVLVWLPLQLPPAGWELEPFPACSRVVKPGPVGPAKRPALIPPSPGHADAQLEAHPGLGDNGRGAG